jgi:hypothetical protein
MKKEPSNIRYLTAMTSDTECSSVQAAKYYIAKSPSRAQPRNGEKQLLDTDEPVEFENNRLKFRRITYHLRGNCRTQLSLLKLNRKIDMEAGGLRYSRTLTDYAQKSTWTAGSTVHRGSNLI